MSLNIKFDSLGNYRTPLLTLANPQKNQIDIVGMKKDVKFNYVFNGLSELSFTIPYLIPCYQKVIKDRLIRVDGLGWFIITKETEKNNGFEIYKEISCCSFEYALNRETVNIADGTYQFYNPTIPFESLLYKALLPTSWSIGYVSSSLYSKWRTFEISDNPPDLYSFLMRDVANAYECIFKFDSENMVVNVYDSVEAVLKSDIYLSLDNLIKQIDIETNDDEIVTVMRIEGDGTFDISSVNPLGTPLHYDFSYFKSTEFMSHSLIASLGRWEALLEKQQPIYSDLLSQLKIKNAELITLNSELVELQSEYKSLETLRTEKLTRGDTDLSVVTNQIAENESKQKTKQQFIDTKTNEILSIQLQLTNINNALKFENSFSASELKELRCFFNTGTYKNENFSTTDNMSPIEVQELAQTLYEQGIEVHSRQSQPIYTFSIDAVNFPFLKEYEAFTRQLKLGSTVNIEIRKGLWFKPVVLKIELNYDNPTDFKLTFSNRLRLSDSEWTFNELQNEESKTSNRAFANLSDLINASSKIDEVTEWKNSALNLANQQIQSSDNQEFKLDQFGLWCRRISSDGSFEPEQFRLTNNLMVFTTDNWQSAKMAFGRIPNPVNPKSYVYGLIADILVGNLVATNNLLITNANNSVRIDGSGSIFHNSYISVERADKKARTFINPDEGFMIQTNTGSGYKNTLYIDYDGNATFEGKITALVGSIGGWEIRKDGLYSPFGDYISSVQTGANGQLGKLGLFTWGRYPTTGVQWAKFEGEVYFKNMGDQATNQNFADDSIDATMLKRGSVWGANRMGWKSHIYIGSIGSSDIGSMQIGANHLDYSVDMKYAIKSDVYSKLEVDTKILNTITSAINDVKSLIPKTAAAGFGDANHTHQLSTF